MEYALHISVHRTHQEMSSSTLSSSPLLQTRCPGGSDTLMTLSAMLSNCSIPVQACIKTLLAREFDIINVQKIYILVFLSYRVFLIYYCDHTFFLPILTPRLVSNTFRPYIKVEQWINLLNFLSTKITFCHKGPKGTFLLAENYSPLHDIEKSAWYIYLHN